MRTQTTILIAEDDPGDAFLLENAFAKAGSNVRLQFVRDGLEVLDYVEGNGEYSNREKYPFPAALILDLRLPSLNGFEVIARLRGQLDFRNLVIGVLTGSNRLTDMQRARELGADCCFVKAGSTAKMVELVNDLQEYWEGTNQSQSRTRSAATPGGTKRQRSVLPHN